MLESQENNRIKLSSESLVKFLNELSNLGKKIVCIAEIKIQPIVHYSFVDEVLESLPTKWVQQDLKEDSYETTTAKIQKRMDTMYNDR